MTKEKIDKFFTGQCSRQEAEDFMKWLKVSQNDPELIRYLQQEWDTAPTLDKNYKEREVLKRINHIIDKKYLSINYNHEKQVSFIKTWYKYAAALLILIVSLFVIEFRPTQEDNLTQPEFISITRTTEQGQKLRFMLPDNSMITLNADSHFEYDEDDQYRNVSLSGEAYFEVTNNNQKPFIVKAGEVTATVLGTSFNVSCRKGSNEIYVALVDGRLKVESENQDLFLIPGEKAIFDQNADLMKKDHWEYFDVFGWKEGILFFRDAMFADIIERLEEWYGADFDFNENRKLIKHYSGKFNNEPLSNVLESLSFIYDFTYEINGKHVTIKFK